MACSRKTWAALRSYQRDEKGLEMPPPHRSFNCPSPLPETNDETDWKDTYEQIIETPLR